MQFLKVMCPPLPVSLKRERSIDSTRKLLKLNFRNINPPVVTLKSLFAGSLAAMEAVYRNSPQDSPGHEGPLGEWLLLRTPELLTLLSDEGGRGSCISRPSMTLCTSPWDVCVWSSLGVLPFRGVGKMFSVHINDNKTHKSLICLYFILIEWEIVL